MAKNIGRQKSIFETVGVIVLVALLLIQALALVHIASHKGGMHTDEYYSYILSNSYDADCIADDSEMWGRWLDGGEFKKYLAVEYGERFSYGRVYYNNTLDVHPPLYYFLLHTVCSFAPEYYSPWLGMGTNIVLMLATQVLLFLLAKRVTGSSLWAVTPVAIYGGTMAFVDTALFIRMYALLSFFTVLLLLVHHRFVRSDRKRRWIFGCAGVTFLGIFTQYYFAFFAFFIAASCCVWLLCRRDWKSLLLYAAAMLLSVVLVFVVYPAGITQIMGSETTNIGNEVWGNMLNFSGWGRAVLSMGKQVLELLIAGLQGHLLLALGMVAGVVILSLLFRHKAVTTEIALKTELIETLAVCASLIAAVVVITHVSGKFVYVRYIYNLFPVGALVICLFIWMVSKKWKMNENIVALGVVAVWMVGSIGLVENDLCSYLFKERTAQDQEIIELYDDGKRPLLLLNNGCNYQATGLMHFLLAGQEVFLGDYTENLDMEQILSQVDCSHGAVFVVLTDQYWSTGLDGDEVMMDVVSSGTQFSTYEEIGECDFSTAYLALP